MKQSELLSQWLAEEEAAQIHGWDFSHIHGRYEEGQDLPWDFDQLVRRFLFPEHRILDMDTGGGEFLLSLRHPNRRTSATEGYLPNVQLCRETLLPLGIDFREMKDCSQMPFKDSRFDMVIPDGSFDLVLNRHGDYLPAEVFRVLKPGGIFLTQQVGAENDRELVELLLDPVPPLPFPRQYLSIAREDLEAAGFSILDSQEAFRPIRFWDVGALVWFARIISWEFPGFSVEKCREGLFKAQDILEQNQVIEGMIHRYFLAAEKVE